MAETKNNFIKSKMNKDLDARLIPPGEYRDAENVSISKSEGESVGALENILGNISITDFSIPSDINNMDIIGRYMDVEGDRIIVFMTNYIDTSLDRLANFAPTDSLHYIGVYNILTDVSRLVVSGNFLNFSKTHNIYGINLLDDLLFWTDNRNQPRKININNAWTKPGVYYTTEDHISVAKFYPYQTIDLFKNEVVDYEIHYAGTIHPTSGYTLSNNIPTSGGSGSGLTVNITGVNALAQITDLTINNLGKGYLDGDIIFINPGVGIPEHGDAAVKLTVEIVSTMQDVVSEYLPDGVTLNPLRQPYGESTITWPGDPDYLKERFVRFSYRFKFDDGEYSLIAPFTQECFVPKQDGYFIKQNYQGSWTAGVSDNPDVLSDEEKAYKSTEVGFMVNKINNITLILKSPIPTAKSTQEGNIINGWSKVADELKVTEIDILYKQSDQTAIKIVDTIKASEFANNNSNNLEYHYQSRKPWKTLPTSEVLRVSDQVPVRTLAQEVGGNRVIYGNYVDKHTPPSKLNYSLSAYDKFYEGYSSITGEKSAARKEYQNHTLKRNRNYQVGVVLSDRYGRQSTVILSEIDENILADDVKGSTLFHPFWEYDIKAMESGNFSSLFGDGQSCDPCLITNDTTWPGDSLAIEWWDTINSNKSSTTGEPGLYKAIGSVSTINVTSPGCGYFVSPVESNARTIGGTGTGLTVDYTADTSGVGSILTVTINNPGSGYTVGDTIFIDRQPEYVGGWPSGTPIPSVIHQPNAQFTITSLNDPTLLGWHSFKIVVKQTEQDYYNVYFPGVLNGYIDGEQDMSNPGATSTEPVVHFALHADNLNKIPRDLSLVSPNQVSFRTGRPAPADDPSYYQFTDASGNAFAADPYTEEGEKLLKERDRKRDLDAGSQITNASVKLSPRVINYCVDLGETTLAGNKKYHTYNLLSSPGKSQDTVTTIATGPELGLWDPSASSPYNRAPVFYGYKNNPYIAKTIIGDFNKRTLGSLDQSFGVTGPSPDAGVIRYKISAYPVHGSYEGSQYVAGSKNVRGTPVNPTATGGRGKGILFNITGVQNADGDLITEAMASGTESNVGKLVDGYINLANPTDKEIIGYDDPAITNPSTLDYNIHHTVHAGNGTAQVSVDVTKQVWPGKMEPELAIYETEPIESKLDIYWETSTSGLISNLNTSIITYEDVVIPVGFSSGGGGTVTYSHNEIGDWDINLGDFGLDGRPYICGGSGFPVTSKFWPVDVTGALIVGDTAIGKLINATLVDVRDGNGMLRPPGEFTLAVENWVGGDNGIVISTSGDYYYYGSNQSENNFTFEIEVEVPSATWDTDSSYITRVLTMGAGGDTNVNCQVQNFIPLRTSANPLSKATETQFQSPGNKTIGIGPSAVTLWSFSLAGATSHGDSIKIGTISGSNGSGALQFLQTAATGFPGNDCSSNVSPFIAEELKLGHPWTPTSTNHSDTGSDVFVVQPVAGIPTWDVYLRYPKINPIPWLPLQWQTATVFGLPWPYEYLDYIFSLRFEDVGGTGLNSGSYSSSPAFPDQYGYKYTIRVGP